MDRLRHLTASQLILPAVVAALLVLAGVGIGTAVSGGGGDERASARAAFGRDGPPFGHHEGGRPFPGRGGGGRGFGPGGPGVGPSGGLAVDPDVRQALFDIRAALARQAPQVARSILDRAVKDHKLTRQQADRILQRLQRLGQAAATAPGGGY